MAFYRKKGLQELVPWTPEMDMTSVSISEADRNNGSPKIGDMIAVNSENNTDKWLVAYKFFKDNYEKVESEDSTKLCKRKKDYPSWAKYEVIEGGHTCLYSYKPTTAKMGVEKIIRKIL